MAGFGNALMDVMGVRIAAIFVIAGISLSTLHQSSLGTLFLATPFRLHPLWHTDLLPFLFFVTAVGVGCLTISWVALVVHRLYRAEGLALCGRDPLATTASHRWAAAGCSVP